MSGAICLVGEMNRELADPQVAASSGLDGTILAAWGAEHVLDFVRRHCQTDLTPHEAEVLSRVADTVLVRLQTAGLESCPAAEVARKLSGVR